MPEAAYDLADGAAPDLPAEQAPVRRAVAHRRDEAHQLRNNALLPVVDKAGRAGTPGEAVALAAAEPWVVQTVYGEAGPARAPR